MPSFHPDGAITESKQESQAVDNATTGTQRGRYRRLCSASTSLTSEAGVLNEGPRKDSPSGAHRAPGKELVNLLMSWGGYSAQGSSRFATDPRCTMVAGSSLQDRHAWIRSGQAVGVRWGEAFPSQQAATGELRNEEEFPGPPRASSR